MPNNGVGLVVTSAGSHQLELEKSIKEKSSKKNIKIYFTFSPFCREACGDSLPVYKRLSDNRMFNLSDFSSESFLKTVVYTVGKYSFRNTFLHVDWFTALDVIVMWGLLRTSFIYYLWFPSEIQDFPLNCQMIASMHKFHNHIVLFPCVHAS